MRSAHGVTLFTFLYARVATALRQERGGIAPLAEIGVIALLLYVTALAPSHSLTLNYAMQSRRRLDTSKLRLFKCMKCYPVSTCLVRILIIYSSTPCSLSVFKTTYKALHVWDLPPNHGCVCNNPDSRAYQREYLVAISINPDFL